MVDESDIGQVKVGHSIGESNITLAARYAKNALQLTSFLEFYMENMLKPQNPYAPDYI